MKRITLPTIKPTIVNPDTGEWANLPPPPQDAAWLKRHAADKNAKGQAK